MELHQGSRVTSRQWEEKDIETKAISFEPNQTQGMKGRDQGNRAGREKKEARRTINP